MSVFDLSHPGGDTVFPVPSLTPTTVRRLEKVY